MQHKLHKQSTFPHDLYQQNHYFRSNISTTNNTHSHIPVATIHYFISKIYIVASIMRFLWKLYSVKFSHMSWSSKFNISYLKFLQQIIYTDDSCMPIATIYYLRSRICTVVSIFIFLSHSRFHFWDTYSVKFSQYITNELIKCTKGSWLIIKTRDLKLSLDSIILIIEGKGI